MNTTIAVALITALSTLCGAALASYTSLRIHRRQVGLQRDITASEQAERANAQRKQLRRDAYVGLLTHCAQMEAALDKCWAEKPPKTPNEPISEARAELNHLLSSIEAPMNAVYLEGPGSITDAVALLREALQNEVISLGRFAGENAGKDDSMQTIGLRAGLFDAFPIVEAKFEFIKAAREALGDPPLS